MIIAILGPTASGKSKLALELAQAIKAEIISFDAFQIYRDFDILTNAPTSEELRAVKHHFIHCVSPSDSFSIKDFQREGRQLLSQLLEKKIPVILVGGSFLYLKALLFDYHLDEDNGSTIKYDQYTNEELYQMLKQVDPIDAQKLHPNNRRRVERSLSIYSAHHQNKTEHNQTQSNHLLYPKTVFCSIEISREELYKRINQRVEKMVEDGLFLEIKKIIAKYPLLQTAKKAIGLREYLEHPNLSQEAIINLIQQDTRRYAKRQITFLKHQFIGVEVHPIRTLQEIISLFPKD